MFDVASEIGWAKGTLLTPARYPIAAARAGRKLSLDPATIAEVWESYEQENRQSGHLDFEDLLAAGKATPTPKAPSLNEPPERSFFGEAFEGLATQSVGRAHRHAEAPGEFSDGQSRVEPDECRSHLGGHGTRGARIGPAVQSLTAVQGAGSAT